MYVSLHVMYPLLLSDFNENLIFSTDFRIFKHKISLNFVRWELSYSIRTDRETHRQTDMTKLIVAFHNFTITPKNFRFVYHFGMKIKRMTNVQKPYL
jgi:hypothetical protein